MQSAESKKILRKKLKKEIKIEIKQFKTEFVWEIGLFEKQLGINCTREQIGLFSNFHEWLPQPRVEVRKSPICSQV